MADSDTPSLGDLAADLVSETTDVKDEPVVETPTETESSTNETTQSDDTSEEQSEEETTEQSVVESNDESEESSTSSPADERKQELNREIRDLVTQRRELMQDVERLNAQVYAPQSVEQIMEETGQDETAARMTAMEQRQELQAYNTQVAETQLVLSTESQRVLHDFPMFDPASKEFKPEVANQAASLLAQSMIVDPNTQQIIGSNVSPYKLYKTIAAANQASAVENQIKGKKSAEQMLATSEPQSSASETTEVKDDPFLKGLTSGNRYESLRQG